MRTKVYIKTFTLMFITLFSVTPKGKWSQFTNWPMYTLEYYLLIERSEMLCGATWMNLKSIMCTKPEAIDYMLYDSIYMKNSKGKFIKIESSVVALGWGGGSGDLLYTCLSKFGGVEIV